MLPLKVHNILDYVFGLLLLIIPSLFDSEINFTAQNVFRVCGSVLIVYSLFTRYPFSFFRWIPLGTHMTLDVALGVVLILSPWVLGYRNFLSGGQELLHYAAGFALVGLVALTRSITEQERREREPTYPGRFSRTSRT